VIYIYLASGARPLPWRQDVLAPAFFWDEVFVGDHCRHPVNLYRSHWPPVSCPSVSMSAVLLVQVPVATDPFSGIRGGPHPF
jgi:hypothetical protein